MAPALRRVWVEASCPSCDCDYRVLVTRSAVGAIAYRVVHIDQGIVRTARGAESPADADPLPWLGT